ncbi:hypothetical protein J7F01_33785 [Streptomyces sp. ISL-22]|uniref:hypothetical protein n=1 Tax=unclassified Streptomyces TaxID=2593676 RepID=UPI001BE4F5EC|nr:MULTISPECIES: hypothetical protein [unclassified Streptomyces]MBT2421281.1 hypothetical protein [Streptomyces sp. ISL-24]MBT2437044.1 hypothetical protein [Streptomyces sp. ISL-22]
MTNAALSFYGGVMALIVPLALGVGDPTLTGKAAEIASAPTGPNWAPWVTTTASPGG